MISAVQRAINPLVLDTADSDLSETAEHIRSHHNIVVMESPRGLHSLRAKLEALLQEDIESLLRAELQLQILQSPGLLPSTLMSLKGPWQAIFDDHVRTCW